MSMNVKIMFSDKLNRKDYYPYPIDEKQNKNSIDNSLSEDDFYKADDDRCWESYVDDIDGGDNFADYCESFFEMLDEEGYWD